MTCCTGNIIQFNNALETNIPYDNVAPLVQVVYFQDGGFFSNSHSSGIQFKDGNVKVDHGGAASGFVIVK